LRDAPVTSSCDPYVHVVRYNNSYYLVNGHHRVIKSYLRGEVSILARVKEVENG
jgi:hypothetical protein